MTKECRERIARLASKPANAPFPLGVFEVRPPSQVTWPADLPSSPLLREFYELCDGGSFGSDCDWHSIGTLASDNDRWHQVLAGYYPDGSSPLIAGRHLVFAHDAAGAPYVWDGHSDHVATFFFKGSDFELRADSFAAFLHSLLFRNTASSADDLWYQALHQLNETVA